MRDFKFISNNFFEGNDHVILFIMTWKVIKMSVDWAKERFSTNILRVSKYRCIKF